VEAVERPVKVVEVMVEGQSVTEGLLYYLIQGSQGTRYERDGHQLDDCLLGDYLQGGW
jgi:hypothetical protein